MLRRACIAVLFLTFAVPAAAQEFQARSIQPFCVTIDDLKELVQAARAHDEQWMHQLKDCIFVRKGTKMAIIGDGPKDSGLSSVFRVRVFAGGTSAVGYTMMLPEK